MTLARGKPLGSYRRDNLEPHLVKEFARLCFVLHVEHREPDLLQRTSVSIYSLTRVFPWLLGSTNHRGLLREDSGGEDAQREGDASGEGVGVHRGSLSCC